LNQPGDDVRLAIDLLPEKRILGFKLGDKCAGMRIVMTS